ncbi:MarP family serine protease [Mycetocola zhadangensis]|uniref:MarP family serine protease n=1 Tax=Mycetocola zhadangensis TaxID=1164595 RepID=UPI0019AB155A|nr:MarP family serine protease [Mycetocola zhadangensis]GGE95885.1 serine protease [Mycetocola zhadangensis]
MNAASFGSIALDVVLLVVVVGALIQGYSRGLFRIVGGIAGMIAGGVAAFFSLPLIATWLPEWRVLASIAAAVLLISIGYTVGIALGNLIRRPLHKTPLKLVDKLVGALANTSVALLVISVLAFSAQALGAPMVSQAMASSTVLRTLDSLMPAPVESFLAQVRTTVMNDGLPRVLDAVGVPTTSPDLPAVQLDSPALTTAAASVVRITGNAPSCGTGRVGSGFVVSEDRVVTNAHVLAGVTELVVEAPNEMPRPGRIVYFDPVDDLAVIDVSGLDAPALPMATALSPGSEAAVMGYPFGGPFTAGSASVLAHGTTLVPDIYGATPAPRQVYTLAANVQQGNSGGPLLTTDGAVVGVIFAKSDVTENVGYALTMEEVLPVIAQAPSFSAQVQSGACTR